MVPNLKMKNLEVMLDMYKMAGHVLKRKVCITT